MIKNLFVFIIFLFPSCRLKIFLLKIVPNFNVATNCKIGINFFWQIDEFNIGEGSEIGHMNIFKNVHMINLERKTKINKLNKFSHVYSIYLKNNSIINSKNIFSGIYLSSMNSYVKNIEEYSVLIMREKSNITVGHHFDLLDMITLGKNTVIAGKSSQFWTHSFDINRDRFQAPIEIKDNCYIGSKVLVGPGITISNNTTIGMGSIIPKDIQQDGYFWVSSELHRKRKLKKYRNINSLELIGGNNEIKFFRKEN